MRVFNVPDTAARPRIETLFDKPFAAALQLLMDARYNSPQVCVEKCRIDPGNPACGYDGQPAIPVEHTAIVHSNQILQGEGDRVLMGSPRREQVPFVGYHPNAFIRNP